MLPSISNGIQCTIEYSSVGTVLQTQVRFRRVNLDIFLIAVLNLQDVIYGDVWICSGQSNMERAMSSITNATEEIAASAIYSNIRMYKPAKKVTKIYNNTSWGTWFPGLVLALYPGTVPHLSH